MVDLNSRARVRSTPRLLALVAAAVALGTAGAAAAAPVAAPDKGAPPPPVDIVFLVDSSASISRNDPGLQREIIAEAVAACWWMLPGDRIGVGRFSGWLGTRKRKEIVLPLTELPADADARAALVADLRTKLAAARATRTASDVNAALDILLAEMTAGAPDKDKRVVWAIVITDGDMSVIEGRSARREYIDTANDLYDEADPDTLVKAANEILFTKTLPDLKQRGVIVTLLGVGVDPAKPSDIFVRGKSQATGGAVLAGGDLLDEVVGLLRDNPVRKDATLLYAPVSFAPAAVPGTFDGSARILPGTGRGRLLAFGNTGRLDWTLTGADGADITRSLKQIGGAGDRPWRLAWLEGVAAGEHRLSVRIAGGEGDSTRVSAGVFGHAAVGLEVAWPDDLDPHLAGLPVKVAATVVSLSGDAKGKPATAPGLLGKVRVAYALTDSADGSRDDGAVPAEDSAGRVPLDVPTGGLAPGKCTLSVYLQAFPQDDGSYLYASEPVTREFVLAAGVIVSFATDNALVGQEVGLKATPAAALEPAPAELEIALAPDGKPVTLTLAADGSYTGTTSFGRPGTWKLTQATCKVGFAKGVLVVPGDTPKIKVRGVEMRLLSAEPPHAELTDLEFHVPYREKSSAEGKWNSVPFLVEFSDGAAPETLDFAASLKSSESVTESGLGHELVFSVRPTGPLTGSGQATKDDQGRLRVALELEVGTDGHLPFHPPMEDGFWSWLKALYPVPSSDMGEVEVQATVGEMKLAKSLPAKFVFDDFWEKAARIYAMYWIPVAAFLALLLLLLIMRLFRAKFNEHQLRLAATIGEQGAGFYRLRSLGEDKSRRRAIGTPEVPEAARFRMKGCRLFGRGRVSARPKADDCRVFVHEKESPKWARLAHGDLVRIENGEGQSCEYYYFERPPTGAELEALATGDLVELGPDEFVIVGLD